MVGHGYISGSFRDGLAAVPDGSLVAVVGRDQNRASAYAAEHGIDASYTSVEEALADTEVDALYICTPHPFHLAPALAAVDAGVAVLVEKPMTPTRHTTEALISAARGAGVFAMEGMWTRFLPVYDQVRSWIDDGAIGEVQLLTASFGFRAPVDPKSRLFSPEMAGGGLLDVGVYPLGLANWLFAREPDHLVATGSIGSTGVDEHVAVAARYGPALAQLGCAVRANLDHHATITGTEGRITIPAFWAAQSATLHRGDTAEESSHPHQANGFEYQIAEVQRCVRSGLTESPGMALSDSLVLSAQCDAVRAQLGVQYPFEPVTETAQP